MKKIIGGFFIIIIRIYQYTISPYFPASCRYSPSCSAYGIEALKKHGPFKGIGGACSSTFYITDVFDKAQFTMLALSMANTTFRVLMPNEAYYKWYDDPKNANKDHIWEEDEWDEELDEDEE